ncbi:peptidyl-prolyl cis-trans isomerase FKBP3-like [Styela clava]|uniref:peptidyl-prolyl cis-trans isomerase FKBP3-like n=1 Tax=Styela clava TaxID=7725 RepID=UPI0019395552|nr:peptidyl-prolyl cis-trans isomerase FKBP3-like [Styela clava]
MSAQVERQWTDEQLHGDDVSKKELISFLQTHSTSEFLAEHKLLGSLKNVTKTSKRDALVIAYNALFETCAFGTGAGDKPVADLTKKVETLSTSESKAKKTTEDDTGPPKFKKTNVLKKGDKTNFPKPGDKVKCYYVGKLEDGTVFDSLTQGTKKKKNQPLQFKVGKSEVIIGWDQAVMAMSVGEKCEVTIEPQYAYGKAGKPEAKIPSNATLYFEIELLSID